MYYIVKHQITIFELLLIMFSKTINKPLYLIRRINYWIRVHLTPGGKLVLSGIVISAIVGIDTNKTMAYRVVTFLLFLLLLSFSWRFFLKSQSQQNEFCPNSAVPDNH